MRDAPKTAVEKPEYQEQLREMNEALLVSSVRQHELAEQAQKAEAALRESEARLQLALDASDMGTFLYHVQEDRGEPDTRMLAHFGLPEGGTINLAEALATLIHPDDSAGYAEAVARATDPAGTGALREHIRVVHPDGSVRWLAVTGQTSFEGEPRRAVRMSGLIADITSRKQAEQALRKSEEQLRRHGAELEQRVAVRTAELSETNTVLQTEIAERKQVEAQRMQLLRRFVSVQEEERRRLSRELHDQFGQQLVALNINLDLLKECYGEPEKLHERIDVINSIVKQLDADVDFLVWGLRPTTLDDLGLLFALDDYVNEWSKHNNVPVQFHRDETDERLAPEIEITLYRIAQEALNNVSKHAQAKRVSVILERRESTLSLIIEDDGQGFDTSEPETTDGKKLGLTGMRERAALVGGTVDIESSSGEGTTVFVRIPVTPDAGANGIPVRKDER